MHGGGFVGTLWPNEEENFIRILKALPDKKTVVFPQTVYFLDKNGNIDKQVLDELQMVLTDHKEKIDFFLRDKTSFEFMENNLPVQNVKYHLVPDIVTYLRLDIRNIRKKIVLLCMRSDSEKTVDERSEKSIAKLSSYLESLGYEIRTTDTMAGQPINIEDREAVVQNKLSEFSIASLVITDRLHGMLFATITGTPCISFDNVSHKVSGQYEWIKSLGYIINCSPEEVDEKLLNKLLLMKDQKYHNDQFSNYYSEIVDAVMNKSSLDK